MSDVYHSLADSDFSQNWSGTSATLTTDNWSGIPSIVGYRGDGLTANTSTDPQTTLAATPTGPVNLIDNSTSGSSTGGIHEISNDVVALQGSGTADAPHLIVFLDTTGVQNVHFTALLRELDSSTVDQKFAVQYRIGDTGDFINLPAGAVSGVFNAAGNQTASLDVTLPAAANDHAQVQVRIITNDAPSADAMVGIDDINISSAPLAGGDPRPGALSIADVSVIEGDGGGQTAMSFVVTRAGGDDGEVSVDYHVTLPGGLGGADAPDFAVAPANGMITFADGETTKTITLQIAADTDIEPTETFTVGLSDPTGGATVADGSATGTILSDDVALSYIHDIQGSAFFSPILAAEGITSFNTASTAQVTISAVVTAIDTIGTLQGFYLSEELTDWDASLGTSEGIFVRTTSPVSGLVVGETVTLTANVMEYQDFTNLNRTILVNATNIAQGNDSVALPTLLLDGSAGKHIPNQITSDDNPDFTDSVDDVGDSFDPENDALDFYETIEGMHITIPDMVVGDGFVGGSNDNFVYFNAYSTAHADPTLINSRGGYTITGDPQFYPVDTPGTGDDVIRGGRHLTDGAQHPDVLELDFGNVGRGGTSGFDQLLTMGDELGDVTGILDFDFGVTKLYVTEALDPTAVANLGDTPVQEVTALDVSERSLRVATFNVENLSPVGTTFSTNNGVEITTQAKYDALAANIANNLKSPDIIVIEEMQDNNGVTQDGVTDASTTWGQLVAAVNAATGKTYQWVDEAPETSGDVGGAPGGNIRVGFLYDTARVQLGDLAGDASLAERRAYTDRIGDGVHTAGDLIAVDDSMVGGINTAEWAGTRRSIVGEFNFNGQAVYVFGSHLPSKGGSGEPFQIDQNIDAGAPANGDWALRSALAQDVWSMQNLVSTTVADAKVVGGGDFNEFWFNRPLEVLTGYATPEGTARADGTKYVNLMVQELSPAERFSYDFDGRSQALDTLIADQALAAVAEFDAVHINTGYNDRTGAVNPASSDHDPSVARFDFTSFDETLKTTADDDSLDGAGGSDTFVFNGARAGYAISYAADIVTIVDTNLADGDDGTDTLTNFEFARFLDTVVTLDGASVITGTAGRDTLTGTTDADTIFGLAGNDILYGGAGDDLLIGGRGTDTMSGGDGIDTASYESAARGVSVSLVSGWGSFGEAFGDRYVHIENVIGSAFDDVLVGSRGANVLRGGDGNDIIAGEGAVDSLYGDAGDDVFVLTNNVRLAALDGGAGSDTILASGANQSINWMDFVSVEAISGDGYAGVVINGSTSTTVGDTIDLSSITLTDIVLIKGNGGNDAITGSAGADTIQGNAGDDLILGGAGADILAGGIGIDRLTGGLGADRFAFARSESGRTVETADTILDFSHVEGDRIDLGAIDANSANGAGDDAFSFIGAGAFTKVAGQLRYEAFAGDTYVSGDTNGDGRADFMIHLSQPLVLVDTDFIL